MNRTEAERLAILETEMKHMAKAHEEMAETLKSALEELGAIRKEQAAMFNQLKGGKLALGVMITTASGAGASVMWFIKEFFPLFSRGG